MKIVINAQKKLRKLSRQNKQTDDKPIKHKKHEKAEKDSPKKFAKKRSIELIEFEFTII